MLFSLLGSPTVLSNDWLQQSLEGAMAALHEETSHSRTGFLNNDIFPDPGLDPIQDNRNSKNSTNRDPRTIRPSNEIPIWKLLPSIQHLPEDMLKNMPIQFLFQLNTALAKESKIAGKMHASARLAVNAQQIISSPTRVPAGLDDRGENLHLARFLGGASCSAQSLWLKARKALGPKGSIPLGNYDLDSLGCGGCVTPKGWIEIHNPSSTDLKLKLFHMPNVGGCGAAAKRVSVEDESGSISIGEDLKEVSDLEGLKAALNALREAMASALPWNRSVGAIVGFMTNTNFCWADLGNNNRRAAILTEFIDYSLGRNALNWMNNQPFLSADDLSHVWATWKAKRASLFSTAADKKTDRKQPEQKTIRVKDDICRKFNSPAGCPAKPEDCKTFYGTKLRHVCNVFLPGGRGKKCEQAHPRKDHK